MPTDFLLCRRKVLLGLCAAACTRPQKLDSPPTDSQAGDRPDTGVDCTVVPGAGWIEIPLADYPILRTEGGWASISLPEHFLEVIVGKSLGGCWFAAWRICTHGACELTYVPEDAVLVCPCHDSHFAEDGAVVVGPATRALTTFPVGIAGDALWIYRPM